MILDPFSCIVGAVSGATSAFAFQEWAVLALQRHSANPYIQFITWRPKPVSEFLHPATKTVSSPTTTPFWNIASSTSAHSSVQSTPWLWVRSIIFIIVLISTLIAPLIIFWIHERTRANSGHQEVVITSYDESNRDPSRDFSQVSNETIANDTLIFSLKARVAELENEMKNYEACSSKFRASLDASSRRSGLTLSMIPSSTISISPVEAPSTNIHGIYCRAAAQTHSTAPPVNIPTPETQKSSSETVQSQIIENQKSTVESTKKQLSQNRFLALAIEENSDGDDDDFTTIAVYSPSEQTPTLHRTPEPTSTEDQVDKEWIHPRRSRNKRRGGPNKGRRAPKTPKPGQCLSKASTVLEEPSTDMLVEREITSATFQPEPKAKAD
ncbi:MAG: hypothetical protein Q9167_006283 [Letrouitia subvulpina]